jgi:hypothetical protein
MTVFGGELKGSLLKNAPPSKSAAAGPGPEPGNPQSADAARAAAGESAANPQCSASAAAGDWLARLQRNMTSPVAPPVSRLEEDVRRRLRAGSAPRALLRDLSAAL